MNSPFFTKDILLGTVIGVFLSFFIYAVVSAIYESGKSACLTSQFTLQGGNHD